MDCILRECPHDKGKACQSLGTCGADYALRKARESGGYRVINFNNPTVAALLRAGLAVVEEDDRHSILKAV